MNTILLRIKLILVLAFTNLLVHAQCTIPSSSCGGYTVQVTITPTSIVPSSMSCGPGYNYNVTFNYSITVSGANTCYNGNIGIQPQIFCNSQNNGYYTINVPAPTVGTPSTNTYTGTLTTTTNPWRPVSDCASATPASLNCNSIDLTIFGPGISTTTVNCTTPSTSISTGAISGAPFCAGAAVSVPYTATGTFNSGNVFTAQLSNSTGSFASPTNIGTVTSTTSGTIAATIPGGTATGSNYRIRVVGSNPNTTGSDNGSNISISTNVTPTVSLASSAGTTICSGASVTFTATPTNGGASPTYNFRVNGSTVQNTTSNTYTTTGLTNGQTVNVIMTSNATCPSPTTATSSTLTMAVNANVTPSVSIASSAGTTICSGASVTFTATPTNGGASPTYNFRVNGSTVQNTTSNTYTTTSLTNGQTVNVIMTSNATCPSPTTATSSTLTMNVNSNVTPSVSTSITVGNNPSCNLATVTFTANPTNGGSSPTYQWTKNGSNISGATSLTYTAIAGTDFVAGDLIRVVLTSNASCVSPTSATSSAINMNIKSLPSASVNVSPTNICSGATVNLTSSAGTFPGTILSENFNGSSSWTTTNNSTGGTPSNAAWTLRPDNYVSDGLTFSSNTNDQFYLSDSRAQGGGTSATITTLVSPTINTVGYSALTLDFWQYFRYNGGSTTDSAIVEVSTNGGTNWTIVASYVSLQGVNSSTFGNPSINLNSYVDKSNLKIRFRYATTGRKRYWAIDNVTLSGTPLTYTYGWVSTPSGFTSASQNTTATPSVNTNYTVTITSSNGCSINATTSNVTVTSLVTPSITISSSQINLCTAGISFSSSINNGGTTPAYQWKKNGSNILGETNANYTATNLLNGDLITCELTSNAACASSSIVSSNTITVNLTGSTTTWLGLSNDWSIGSPINWSNGYPSSNTTAIIPAGTPNNPEINDIVECFNLELQAGASLTINGVNQLNIYGKFTNNGSFNAGFGNVEFLSCAGSSAQAHEITSTNGTTSSFFNVNLNDLAGLNLTSNAAISGALTLTNGTFNNSGQLFTFISTATGTARIAPVGSTANYVGNITMQRYAPGPKTGWAQLGTPIQGATLTQWYDNFPMQGFTGVFGSGSSGFVSVYTYNETIAGVFDASGSYVGATNVTNTVPVGKGFWLYLGNAGAGGSSSINTLPITIDVTGQPYVGNFNFNPTYTNSGNPFDDGYNLIANPYPSAIDWLSSNWTKTNINNAIYMYQADNGQYASFVGGIATNGGSRYIASSQGFYIQANAASPVLIINENAKTASNPVLIKEEDPSNVLRLKVEGDNVSDEMVIHLNEAATNQFDSNFDAKKMFSNDPMNPSISSICNNKDMAINSLPFNGNTTKIPVRVTVGKNGMYKLTWTGLEGFADGSCFVLEDMDKAIKTSLQKDQVYYFNATAGFKAPRFIIHISTPLPNTITNAKCSNSSDGSITVSNASNTTTLVQLRDEDTNILEEAQVENSYTFSNLKEGLYTITYPEALGCGSMSQSVKVSANKAISAEFEMSSSAVFTDDDVTFTSPQIKSNNLTWDFGDGTIAIGTNKVTHQYKNEGIYNVSMTNQSGDCSITESSTITVRTGAASATNNMDINMQNGLYYAVFYFTENAKANISIVNALGQEVLPNYNFEGKNGKVKLEMENLVSGVYLVSVSCGEKVLTKKIVK
jgi:hypothetical protein